MKLDELLSYALSKTNDLDKQHSLKWLLLSMLNLSLSDYYIYSDKELDDNFVSKYKKLSNKYLNEHIPVQYLANKAYFYGNEFYINEDVLIPRADTEGLIENLNKLINDKFKNNEVVKVLDLATGSGIIGITLKLINEKVDVTLTDVSLKALEVAKVNINNFKLNINTIQSDWFNNINEKYDVIVSNPPYIKEDYILEEHVLKEPHIALFSGKDGLDSYNTILKNIEAHLNENYIIAFEHGYDQKDKIKQLTNKYIKDANIKQLKDLSKNDRYTFIIK